jgi:hypothetical protein
MYSSFARAEEHGGALNRKPLARDAASALLSHGRDTEGGRNLLSMREAAFGSMAISSER